MAKRLILGKAGISFLPGLSVRQEVAAGSLIPIQVPGTEGIALQTNVISNPGEHGQFLSEIIAIGKQFNGQGLRCAKQRRIQPAIDLPGTFSIEFGDDGKRINWRL